MSDAVKIILAYAIVLLLFFWLSRDAERHDIYLGRGTKVLFLLTFTAPFVIIWYIVKRIRSSREQESDDPDENEITNEHF